MIVLDFVNNRVIIQRTDGSVSPVNGNVVLTSTGVPPTDHPRD